MEFLPLAYWVMAIAACLMCFVLGILFTAEFPRLSAQFITWFYRLND